MQNPITIVDLERIRDIIDVAAGRGAFKPAEMRVVGETYDRLTAFLQSVTSQADTAPSEPKGENE